MTNDELEYDVATIRQLLRAAFTASTLPRFCRDRPTFRPVLDEFSPGHGLADMVDELITYCDKNLLLDELLAEIRKAKPRQYARFESQLRGTALSQPSSPAPPETVKESKQPPLEAARDVTPAKPEPEAAGVRSFERPARFVVQPRWLVALIAALVLVVIGILGSLVVVDYLQERKTPAYWIDRFRNVESPDLRVDALSRIIALSGEQQTAQSLFFGGLTPAEQVKMFEVADPEGLQQELTVVVKAIYTWLPYSPDNHKVLEAIKATLSQIEEPREDAEDLRIEVAYWCDGQGFYVAGEYNQAIEAYNVAIAVNKKNPATYWDRAVAHAAQGNLHRALADNQRVIALDQARQDRVIRIIEQDPDAFTYLGLHRSNFPSLATFFPTLTPTPTPTFTPTPTPSPTPTFTPTPTPSPTSTFTPTPTPSPTSTSTPTPTHTFTPTPTSTSTPTPAGGPTPYPAPVLLNPLPAQTLTGPTLFQWQWDHQPLSGNFCFDLRIWSVWEDGSRARGILEPIKQTQVLVDLQFVPAIREEGAGDYIWTVVVVETRPDGPPLVVGEWADARHFTYRPAKTPGPSATPSGP